MSSNDNGNIDVVRHVCFCADGRYVRFIIPALESLVRSSVTGARYHVHVIVDHDPGEEFRSALDGLCAGLRTIYVIEAGQFGDLLEVTHISRGMYYRLMIPELVDADRVLYLDCDVIVRRDLGTLFSLPLDDQLGAGVVNPFHDARRLGLQEDDVYFNSGVMLINTRAWIRFGLKEKVLAYLRENVQLLRMPDQDALNAVMRGRWVELDPTFNCQVSMLLGHEKLAAELAPRWGTDFLRDPAIMHFSAGHKQWHSSNRIRYSREYRSLSTHIMERRRGRLMDALIARMRQLKYAVIQSNPFFY